VGFHQNNTTSGSQNFMRRRQIVGWEPIAGEIKQEEFVQNFGTTYNLTLKQYFFKCMV
jgi:hypothetical protein